MASEELVRFQRVLAQRYREEAILALAAVMRDPAAPHMARVKAASALLDRGHGRPTQQVETRINPLAALSDEELEAAIEFFRKHCELDGGGDCQVKGVEVPVH